MSTRSFGRRALFGFGWGDMPSSRVDRPARVVARLVPGTCLGPTSFCRVCAERCPVRAIVFDGGRPRIDETRCDGCGECECACPAPGGAITCVPNVAGR